jgi:hypothetical protein
VVELLREFAMGAGTVYQNSESGASGWSLVFASQTLSALVRVTASLWE